MRNLIAFYKKFRVFLLFVLFQIIALSYYFSNIDYPKARFLNTSNTFASTLLTWERDMIKHFSLDEANKELQLKLKTQLEKQPERFTKIDDNTYEINDTILGVNFQYLPATVINNSYTRKNNYFTINIGSINGVEPNMGVINENGVIGIVHSVKKHYALVKSILTTNFNVSAYLDNNHAHGIIKYLESNPNYVNLIGISNDIEISIGTKVYTKGSSGYFPMNVLIGTVENIELIEGKPEWDIKIKLAQDMRKLHYAYVVKNIFQEELDLLLQKIEQE